MIHRSVCSSSVRYAEVRLELGRLELSDRLLLEDRLSFRSGLLVRRYCRLGLRVFSVRRGGSA
jgi:hypothetical protein